MSKSTIPFSVPDEYKHTICAFRVNCPDSLTTPVVYNTPGWVLWQIHAGELFYTIDGHIHRAYQNCIVTLSPDDTIIINSYNAGLKVSVIGIPPTQMNMAIRSETAKQRLLSIGATLKSHHAMLSQELVLSSNVQLELHYIYSVLIEHVPPAKQILKHDIVMPLVEAMVMMVLSEAKLNRIVFTPHGRSEMIAAQFLVSMQENYVEHFDVAFYASQACVSIKYFTAIVKGVTNTTPQEWISRMRTMRICELLKTTDLQISQIAEELYFSSSSSFVRFFHRRMGMTPKQYRDIETFGSL